MTLVAWYVVGVLIAIPVLFFLNWLYGIWRDTRPDRMRAIFISEDRQLVNKRVKIGPDGKSFRIVLAGKKRQKYAIKDTAVVRTGTFRIPTSVYVLGRSEPLDLLQMKATDSIASGDYEEATESNVALQIIKAFSDDFISPTTTLLLVIVAVVVVVGFGWWDTSQDLNTIIDGLGLKIEPSP